MILWGKLGSIFLSKPSLPSFKFTTVTLISMSRQRLVIRLYIRLFDYNEFSHRSSNIFQRFIQIGIDLILNPIRNSLCCLGVGMVSVIAARVSVPTMKSHFESCQNPYFLKAMIASRNEHPDTFH